MEENLAKETNTELSKDEEIKSLREELAALKKAQEDKNLSDSLDKKIDELVAQKLKERDNNERERIENARRMIEEADKNAALERELMNNDKYNQINSWRENKLQELRREIDLLARMGGECRHSANLYRDYDRYQAAAVKGDERAKRNLGYINLTYAAMHLGGEKLVNIFKKNIGLVE